MRTRLIRSLRFGLDQRQIAVLEQGQEPVFGTLQGDSLKGRITVRCLDSIHGQLTIGRNSVVLLALREDETIPRDELIVVNRGGGKWEIDEGRAPHGCFRYVLVNGYVDLNNLPRPFTALMRGRKELLLISEGESSRSVNPRAFDAGAQTLVKEAPFGLSLWTKRGERSRDVSWVDPFNLSWVLAPVAYRSGYGDGIRVDDSVLVGLDDSWIEGLVTRITRTRLSLRDCRKCEFEIPLDRKTRPVIRRIVTYRGIPD